MTENIRGEDGGGLPQPGPGDGQASRELDKCRNGKLEAKYSFLNIVFLFIVKRLVSSTGMNRFSCFMCDYDLCLGTGHSGADRFPSDELL